MLYHFSVNFRTIISVPKGIRTESEQNLSGIRAEVFTTSILEVALLLLPLGTEKFTCFVLRLVFHSISEETMNKQMREARALKIRGDRREA